MGNPPAAVRNDNQEGEKKLFNLQTRIGSYATLPEIIGLPPLYDDGLKTNKSGIPGPSTSDVIKDSMPILEIEAATPQFAVGLELFTLKTDMNGYAEDLRDIFNIGLNPNSTSCIKVAFLGVTPPMESFSNDYGDSMFSQYENASAGLGEAAFIFGSTDINQAVESLRSGVEEARGGKTSSILDSLGNSISRIMGVGREAANKVAQSGEAGRLAVKAAALAARSTISRKDFPQVWKSASWSSSYSVQVRLYNPFPNSAESTTAHIIAPLAALLMFVVPRTDDGFNFHWPWCCRFKCKGLFDVEAGYVKSIQVVKGGDDNNIAFNQRVGIVDLKIELGTLYNSMITTKSSISQRPSLTSYLDQFAQSKDWTERDNSGMGSNPSWVRWEENNTEPTTFSPRSNNPPVPGSTGVLPRGLNIESPPVSASSSGGDSPDRQTSGTRPRIPPDVFESDHELEESS